MAQGWISGIRSKACDAQALEASEHHRPLRLQTVMAQAAQHLCSTWMYSGTSSSCYMQLQIASTWPHCISGARHVSANCHSCSWQAAGNGFLLHSCLLPLQSSQHARRQTAEYHPARPRSQEQAVRGHTSASEPESDCRQASINRGLSMKRG